MKHIYLSFLVLVIIINNAIAGVYYISPQGEDSNSGSKNSPWKSISVKAPRLMAGDTLYLLSGNYTDPVIINNLKGNSNSPILISAAPNSDVVFDGTYVLPNKWELVTKETDTKNSIQDAQWDIMKGDLYVLEVPTDLNLLIYNDRIMDMATWPNTSWYAPFRLDRTKTLRRADDGSKKGMFFDADPTVEAEIEAATWLTYDRIPYMNLNKETLASTNINHTGSIVVMNHAWSNYCSRITKHVAGENFFSWDITFSESGNLRSEVDQYLLDAVQWDKPGYLSKSSQAGIHYFIAGLSALDNPYEWWYDKSSNKLYFVMPVGEVPANNLSRGKTVDYMLNITNSENIIVSGINFYGTAFSIIDCKNTTIKNCNQIYSSFNKLVYGDFSTVEASIISNKSRPGISYGNKIQNCQFQYLDGNSFEGRSEGLVVDNLLIYQTQQTCLGMDSRSVSFDRCSVIRRVTISDVGASVGIKGSGPCLYELNDITRFGGLQYDGAALQSVCKDPGTLYRYNWSHDHPKSSFRFDASNYPSFTNKHCGMAYNVAWNTPFGYRLKGDELLFHNNVLIDSGATDADAGVVLFNMAVWASTNIGTLAANNAVVGFSSGDKNANVLATMKNNKTGDIAALLNDPSNRDFRPKKGSALIDAGYKVVHEDVPWDLFEITGKNDIVNKPDIGAYEFGTQKYWIPGYKFPKASSPIPLDKAIEINSDVDLIFLNGYEATSVNVFFGDSENSVASAGTNSELFLGNYKGENNVVDLNSHKISIERSKTYYWRVDAILPDGSIEVGDVWKFSTKESFDLPIYVYSIVIDKNAANMNVKKELLLNATIIPSDATDKSISWLSSNEAVVTVSENGLVKAIKEGEAYIYAISTYEGLKDSCLITVENSTAVRLIKSQDMKISPNPASNSIVVENFSSKTGTPIVKVFDSVGRLCHVNQTIDVNQISIDISSLVSGIYFLKIDDKCEKFIKN